MEKEIARRELPAPRSIYTAAHQGYCTKDCYPKYNPADLGYAVVKNGAVQKHHRGPHAQELARSQAAQTRDWAAYFGERAQICVEEFAWQDGSHKRTATAREDF